MAVLAPTFTIGAKITASIELPFIISVSLFIQVDFAKLSMVMSSQAQSPKISARTVIQLPYCYRRSLREHATVKLASVLLFSRAFLTLKLFWQKSSFPASIMQKLRNSTLRVRRP